MKAMARAGFCAVMVAGLVSACLAQTATNGAKKAYGPPGKFEKDIQAFEAADQKAFTPAGAIVCLGSSSMRMWHGTIKEDLAPLTVIPRGFGGSSMNEALHVVDRIVAPYKPRAILLYEGDNDVAAGIAPETLRDTFLALVEKVRVKLPDARFYVISIKPSVKRWKIWPHMKEANRLLAESCAEGKGLSFIDVATPMLDAQGNPRKELLKADDLHMTRAGYEIWRDTVKPVLLKGELPFEAKK